MEPVKSADTDVLTLSEIELSDISELLARFGLQVRLVAEGEPIPGTYWGEPEAGLVGDTLYARRDTPVHSVVHEACHSICMGDERRRRLDRDAGGDDAEENAVCYLQILLADDVPGMGRERMLRDMDAWGYSFRLGASRLWFEQDAEDARTWLQARALLSGEGRPRWPETT